MSTTIRLEQLTDVISRGDIPHALAEVLEDAPYGPNVEDAKVHSSTSYWSHELFKP